MRFFLLFLLGELFVLASNFIVLAELEFSTWVFLVFVVVTHVIDLSFASSFGVTFGDQAYDPIL